MIEKQLKVGDHIVDSMGCVYRIERINKSTYYAKNTICDTHNETVPFNGLKHSHSDFREYFECNDVQMEIIKKLVDIIGSFRKQSGIKTLEELGYERYEEHNRICYEKGNTTIVIVKETKEVGKVFDNEFVTEFFTPDELKAIAALLEEME